MKKWLAGVCAGMALALPSALWATAAEERFNEIIREQVPPNATEFQITNFLYSAKLNYTETQGPNPTIEADILPSQQNYLLKGALHITFKLNQNRLLDSYTVHEDITPPSGANGQAH